MTYLITILMSSCLAFNIANGPVLFGTLQFFQAWYIRYENNSQLEVAVA
jgi:hypothetical protein